MVVADASLLLGASIHVALNFKHPQQYDKVVGIPANQRSDRFETDTKWSSTEICNKHSQDWGTLLSPTTISHQVCTNNLLIKVRTYLFFHSHFITLYRSHVTTCENMHTKDFQWAHSTSEGSDQWDIDRIQHHCNSPPGKEFACILAINVNLQCHLQCSEGKDNNCIKWLKVTWGEFQMLALGRSGDTVHWLYP